MTWRHGWLALVSITFFGLPVFARDYFLTLGGGYAPEGNQASLEANVQFMQLVLVENRLQVRPHRIYFADGFDQGHDLQCVDTSERKQESEAVQALKAVFRISDQRLYYRNHQVSNLSGGLRTSEIREGLQTLREQLTSGDRLIIYVTAHGSAGKQDQPRNTSISCWGNKALRMSEFSGWLDELPSGVTVISIMAQCYCGGFADTIYRQGDAEQGFSENIRTGFFAQRHDLPAAGCRPEVENDEEYSSFFWGAFVGRSRTGKPAANIDCNNDKRISFAEAHAHAVLASETIDIPLCASEALLRQHSELGSGQLGGERTSAGDDEKDDGSTTSRKRSLKLTSLEGTLYELASRGRPEETRMIIGLAEKLKIPVSATVADVQQAYADHRSASRSVRSVAFRRGRGSSSRRRMQATVVETWPELESPAKWSTLPLLNEGDGEPFLEQLRALPGYAEFDRGQTERAEARAQSLKAELMEVKYRRLLHQLENIVLAENLPSVAQPATVKRYRELLAVEAQFLNPSF